MANVAAEVALPASFSRGKGLKCDNKWASLVVVDKDATTSVVVTSTRLKRIEEVSVFDSTGAVVNATLAGLGTNQVTLTNLGAGTQDLLVVLKGSRV